MRNALRLARNDAHRITRSAVAMVVIMGLCIVPCLYAWFNIFSNWDPYGESATSRIRVAVFSQDKGADMLGIELNIGDTIMQTLKSNDQIGWVFAESQREALGRVYSGDCYAALIVPPSFSKDFVSFVTLKFKHPQLYYYDNGKKNAIAPKITGQARNSVQNQVNAAFLSTVVSSVAKVLGVLESNGVDVQQTMKNLSNKIEELSGKLDGAITVIDSLSSLTGASRNLLYASGTLVADMSLAIGYSQDLANMMQSNMIANGSTLRQNISTVAEALLAAQDNVGGFYGDLSRLLETDAALDTLMSEDLALRKQAAEQMKVNAEQMAQLARERGLNGLATMLDLAADHMKNVAERLDALQNPDPENPEGQPSRSEEIQAILEELSGAKSALGEAAAEAAKALGLEVEDALYQASQSAGGLADMLGRVEGATARIATELYALSGTMGNLESHAMEAKANILRAQQKLRDLSAFLEALADSEFLNEVLELLREGPDVLGEKIASPIQTEDIILFNAESYGTQMAPFYTVLAQWVGALFCAVLLKTRVRPEDKPRRLNMPQHFFGRYAIFFFVGIVQAVIVAAGDLWYIGILCEHPDLFMLAAVVTGVCFTMINYVLAFTLGAAGLAASVIIMVIQVGGAGGTYPVEVLPPIFQKLYPYMPFKFAMNAMREAISGLFNDNYAYNISWLLTIIGVCILFAFVMYLPGKWLNGLLEKAKKKSGIMI